MSVSDTMEEEDIYGLPTEYIVKEEDEDMEVKGEFEGNGKEDYGDMKVDSKQTELLIIKDEDENIKVKEEVPDEEDPLSLPGLILFRDN